MTILSRRTIDHFSDAILGIRELLDSNPELLGHHLNDILKNSVRLVGDEVGFALLQSKT